MKKYLLPSGGNFYKANLHCHTTVSDGALTPAEVKELYRAHGYSIVAFTDHDIMIPHPELRDENFLPLLGYEMEVNASNSANTPFKLVKTCHMCLIALSEEAKQVCFHRSRYLFGNASQYREQARFDDSLPDYERSYSAEGINDMMRRGREGGFFVTYNHPRWSQETYENYSGYCGMHAMEVFNSGCVEEGYEDECPGVYDEMLRLGKHIYCIAADDNHNKGDVMRDACRGFTMIKAPALAYGAVVDALVKGHFYASTGPLIHSLTVEDGVVHITCSPVRKISLGTAIRVSRAIHAKGELLTEASFPIAADYGYFRLTVEDAEGRRAYTNAYFTDEWLEEAKK